MLKRRLPPPLLTIMIEIKNVSFCYRDNNDVFLALEDIDLTIADGEFVCLIGHSGCGKSTLLSLLAGLNLPDAGTITIDGVPVKGPDSDRAMVFQHYSLFPWMTVSKNVTFSILHSRRRISKAQAKKKALKYLDEVGMADAANKYPFQLSGGMQQRVAIARALAMESDILLLDEPFGALDARNRVELQQLLLELWHSSNQRRTVVFVTHDLSEALLLADRVVFMRPKRLQQVVNVSFPRPRNLETLATDPQFRAMRNELMHLFYVDDDAEGESRTHKHGVPTNLFNSTPDTLHYDNVQGGT